MILSVHDMSLKMIKNNRIRIILSAVGLTIAFGFIISMMAIFQTIDYGFKDEIKKLYGDIDVMAGYNISDNKYLTDEQINKIQSLSGISSVSKLLVNPQISVQNVNIINNKPLPKIYTIGSDNSILSKSRYKFNCNLNLGEVIVTESLAKVLKIKEGQYGEIPLPNIEKRKWKVVEIISDPKTSNAIYMAIFNLESFQDWVKLSNCTNCILLKLKPNTNKQTMVNELKRIDSKLRVEIIEESDYVRENILSMKVMGYGLGILVAIICFLYILSNFRLFISENQQELSILRAIGGNRFQCFSLFLPQCIFIVLLGSISGLLIGIFSVRFISKYVFRFFNIPVYTYSIQMKDILITYILCTLVVFIFLVVSTYKMVKILPIQVLTNIYIDNSKPINKYKWLCITFISCSLILLVIGLNYVNDSGLRALSTTIGGILFIFGIFLGFRYIVKYVLLILMPLWKLVGGNLSFVAIKNMISQSSKSAIVILTLAGTLTIAIPSSSLFATLKENMEKSIRLEYVSDIVLSSSYGYQSTLSLSFNKEIENIEGVKGVVRVSQPEGADILSGISNPTASQFVYTLVDLETLSKFKLIPNMDTKLSDTVILSKSYANSLGLKLGDKFTVVKEGFNYKNEEKTLVVGAIIDTLPGLSTSSKMSFVDWNNKSLYGNKTMVKKFLINIDTSKESIVERGLNNLKDEYGEIKWSDLKGTINQMTLQVQQRYFLISIITCIVLIIGIFGIITTLSSRIQEQRREYAILRAISVTPRQLFIVILSQSILHCFIAIIMGIITGLVITYSIIYGLGGTPVIQWRLVVYVSIAIMSIGCILSIPLARNISKKSVVDELIKINA